MDKNAKSAVRDLLRRFQDGYTSRDVSMLDDFMNLFVNSDDIELIGIGASTRGANEWFEGVQPIREIIESDWTYWGDVDIDVDGAKISANNGTAWLSTSGTLTQTQAFDKALPFYVKQMSELLEDEDKDQDTRLVEATHFGMRRVRERHLGLGHSWVFVLTAVAIEVDGGWRFHSIHWSMPVD